jgi:PAS domain-containing protein
MAQCSERQLVALLASLYEAATEPALYAAFAETLRNQLGASLAFLPHAVKQPDLSWYDSAHLGHQAPGQNFIATANFPPDVYQRSRDWVTRDGYTVPAMTRDMTQGGTVFDRREFVGDADFAHTGYYHEVTRSQDAFHLIGGAVFSPARDAGLFLLLGRPHDLAPFGENETRLLGQLLPHLLRAQRIHLKLWALRRQQQGQAWALEHMDRAALVVDQSLRVVWINAAAEAALGPAAGLDLRGGHLRAPSPGQQQLAAVRRRRLIGHDPAGRAGETLSLPRREAAPLRVTVLPVPGQVRPDQALLLLGAAPGRAASPTSALRALYNLTPAESRVSGLLAEGQSVGEIASQVQVAPGRSATSTSRSSPRPEPTDRVSSCG